MLIGESFPVVRDTFDASDYGLLDGPSDFVRKTFLRGS